MLVSDSAVSRVKCKSRWILYVVLQIPSRLASIEDCLCVAAYVIGGIVQLLYPR